VSSSAGGRRPTRSAFRWSTLGRRDRYVLLALATLSLAFAVVQSATGISPDVLLAVPVLLLLLPLLAGRYVGEDGIARLSACLAAPGRRPLALRAAAPRRAPRVLARGGRLIAVALAQRGPPALVPAR
jgi:hypothetical protein